MEYTPLNCAQYGLLEAVLNTLVAVGATMTYTNLAMVLGFNTPRDQKMHVLLAWSMEHDREHGHPLRCSLIVRKDSDMPGDEYWVHARSIGINIAAGNEASFHQSQLALLGIA